MMYLFIYDVRDVCGLLGCGGKDVSIAIMMEQLHQQQVSNQEGWRGKVQNHRKGKELVQSLMITLVD